MGRFPLNTSWSGDIVAESGHSRGLENMMIKNSLSMFFAAALLVGQLCGTAQAAPLARIVAVVNGDMITERELDKAVAPQLAKEGLNPAQPGDAGEIERIKKSVLDNMINEKVMLQAAQKLGISVSDEQVDAAFQGAMRDSQLSEAEFRRQIAAQGLNEQEFRERLRNGLISQSLVRRMVLNKVVVTRDEIDAYYREHSGSMPSGRVRIALLIYPSDVDAEDWARRIGNDKNKFLDAARKLTVGPNQEGGGDMGDMDVADLAPALRMAVSDLKEGQVSPLFATQVSMAQICLLERADGKNDDGNVAGPDDAARARIEEMLAQPRLQARLADYLRDLRSKALVDIRY